MVVAAAVGLYLFYGWTVFGQDRGQGRGGETDTCDIGVGWQESGHH